MIRDRLVQLQERLGNAARRAGRDSEEILLVAVSKAKPASAIIEAYQAGQRHFGENYVQEFQEKTTQLPPLPEAVFHFIGKLQSNKTRPAAALFHVIQTVENEKIARRLDAAGKALDVYLEVKLSPEQAKAGAAETELPALIEYSRSCAHLRLRGLMTMPPWSDDPEHSRPYFRRLRALAERHGLEGLSMGMSHDLEVAIEEGATVVRVGTAIFGPRAAP